MADTPAPYDWVAWLAPRDAQVLLMTLLEEVEAPMSTLEGLRQMAAGWRANALRALDTDDWTAPVDNYLEVRVDARLYTLQRKERR